MHKNVWRYSQCIKMCGGILGSLVGRVALHSTYIYMHGIYIINTKINIFDDIHG